MRYKTQKTTENWEKLFVRFDARTAGMAATATVAALLFSAPPTFIFITGGTTLVFGTMAAIDAHRLKRLKREQAAESASREKTAETQLKRP